jgi:ParB-like chromosome segregation protein Spo0J
MKTPETSAEIAVHCAHAAIVDWSTLRPHPKNPNRHPTEQIALLAKNIRALGWRHPVIVSRLSGYIVAGHARIEAAKLLNINAVPVDYQPFANTEEETAYLIADNRIAELAERDNAILKDLLQELDTGANDMDLTGYTEQALADLMTQFHVEEVNAPELKDGDRAPFRQATFTLHDEQWEEVEAAISKAKGEGGGESAVNENSNGNALAWICGRFNRG